MAFSRARMASSILLGHLRRTTPANDHSFSYSSSIESVVTKKSPSRATAQSMVMNEMFTLDISSQIGSSMPLSMMRIGTLIHNIELRPGQGGKLVRAAGTVAKILTEPSTTSSRMYNIGRTSCCTVGFVPLSLLKSDGNCRFCEIKVPSGRKKSIDTRCRATIGQVSNPGHGAKKLRKAGRSRWLGRRPVVRGVAMNPVDHPHGGGEGKSKSSGSHGRGSQTPWGSPLSVATKLDHSRRESSKFCVVFGFAAGVQ